MVLETRVKYQRLKKWYLMQPSVSCIRYVSTVKWSNQGNGVAPFLHFDVVAIERGAFESFSTAVTNFTYFAMSKQECTRHNKIAYVDYVARETKQSII